MYKHGIAIIAGSFVGMLQIGLWDRFGKPPIILLPVISLLALLLASRTKYIAGFVLAAGITQDIFSPLPFGTMTGMLILIGIIVNILQLTLLSHRAIFSLFGTAAIATAAYIMSLEGIELLTNAQHQLTIQHYFSPNMLFHAFFSACISGLCVVGFVMLLSFSPKYRLKPHILH